VLKSARTALEAGYDVVVVGLGSRHHAAGRSEIDGVPVLRLRPSTPLHAKLRHSTDLAVRTRRLELAAALHARVPKPHLAWQQVLEAAAWVAAGVAIAAAAVAYAARTGNPDPGDWAFLLGARTLAAAAATALLGALAGVATTRERHLFRYFKNR
jgi:hypothetical protein